MVEAEAAQPEEQKLIDRICEKIEHFMFEDTENGGEAIFMNFAA